MRLLFITILFSFLLSACDQGQEEAMAPSKSTGSASGDMGGMDDTGPMSTANGEMIDGTFYPNHEKDYMEFQVRSSLAGVKRMINDYKKEGYETTELEKRKAELEKQLSKMTG